MECTLDSFFLAVGIASIVISGIALSVSIGLSKWFDTVMRNIGNAIVAKPKGYPLGHPKCIWKKDND